MNIINSPYITPDDHTLGQGFPGFSAGTELFFMLCDLALESWDSGNPSDLLRKEDRLALDLVGCLDADIEPPRELRS